MLTNKLMTKSWHKENAANHLISVKLDPKTYTMENMVCSVIKENYERMGANLVLRYWINRWLAGQVQVLGGVLISLEQWRKVIVMGLSLPWTLSSISGSNSKNACSRNLWRFAFLLPSTRAVSIHTPSNDLIWKSGS